MRRSGVTGVSLGVATLCLASACSERQQTVTWPSFPAGTQTVLILAAHDGALILAEALDVRRPSELRPVVVRPEDDPIVVAMYYPVGIEALGLSPGPVSETSPGRSLPDGWTADALGLEPTLAWNRIEALPESLARRSWDVAARVSVLLELRSLQLEPSLGLPTAPSDATVCVLDDAEIPCVETTTGLARIRHLRPDEDLVVLIEGADLKSEAVMLRTGSSDLRQVRTVFPRDSYASLFNQAGVLDLPDRGLVAFQVQKGGSPLDSARVTLAPPSGVRYFLSDGMELDASLEQTAGTGAGLIVNAEPGEYSIPIRRKGRQCTAQPWDWTSTGTSSARIRVLPGFVTAHVGVCD
ncbi:MAG: hypothetical protein HYV07_13220 [Deltaproteobacteria bacterium]|nr:hypothetical protein [Deltaproteobacteria bacterium]